MYEPLRRGTLALLKVPLAPHPPLGDPASLRVFRAGRNYLRLRLAGWAAAQLLALAGILFWTTMLIEVETMARTERSDRTPRPAPTGMPAEPGRSGTPASAPSAANQGAEKNWPARVVNNFQMTAKAIKSADKTDKKTRRIWTDYKQFLVEIALALPAWAVPSIWVLKIFSFFIYLLQIPVTYAVRRLDYELRWYMVTDRSLRIRQGVWKVAESTMSFANLQQVMVTQGPIQRFLGLADVKVRSAGGGNNEPHHRGEDMHLGLFHSVTNAPEIRDLILERLRRFRDSGLGDPDEHSSSVVTAPADAVAAARELVAEARALRVALS